MRAGVVDSLLPRAYVRDMEPDTTLNSALEARGLRRTPQRAAVYRFLQSTARHPTADEVFTAVRSDIPDISLATVYKALEALSACGLATRLAFGDEAARFDARTDDHCHARCVVCGTVRDVAGTPGPALLTTLDVDPGFRVGEVHVEIVGTCASCAAG